MLQIFLLPAVMKLKTQIKIYQRLLNELGRKYDGAEDFISSKVKELCLEHAILEKVDVCICFLCYVHSLVTNTVKNEFFALK